MGRKKAKIKLQTLQKSKEFGGLGLVDFKIKDLAMKVEWVKIVQSDELLSRTAYKILGVHCGALVWKSNLKESDIKKNFKPSFWRDVLIAWARMTHSCPQQKEAIENQMLWFNLYIRVNKQPVFYKKAYNSGLVDLAQLFNPEGELLSFEDCKNLFEISQMEWNALVSAIPKNSPIRG